jgi:cell shape-determining protein MreC
MDYVPQEFYEQTTAFLANYQRTREILEEICEINRQLLQRREAF